MIQLTEAGKRFGPKILFEGLKWLITPKERVGIVGANGTGKSTLLKVLAGIESLDYGTIGSMKGLRTGYLPQDGIQLTGRTVFAECLSVFDEIRALEEEQQSLAHRMSELDQSTLEYQQIAERYHHIQSEFTARDGYNIESRVGSVLSGLGFSRDDWQRRVEQFSGGWQMRIALAKLLLEEPNLLLLDEPTNHLDLEARNWLESYLAGYPNAFVLISHDRYFLDVAVTRIVEIWNKRVYFYTGGYSKFEQQKEERRTQLEAAYANQRDRIEQLEAFINRFRAQATKAKQVQSRIKELEKIERIEVPPDEKTIHFRFPQPKPSGRIVAEFHNVSKSYGPKHVFSGASFNIERGDRIALVGVNGAGKSTLIKILSGEEPVSSGEYTTGHNVEIDYFAQDQYKALDPEATLIDDLGRVAPRANNTELRSILGCFLFSEDDVFKRIGVLSGGERNRYALARMLMMPGNFMLLDEPTNHLDMRAKDVLLTALETFSGTVVFVSHDRYFIDKLATRVIEVADGAVTVYPGNYEDYLWRKSNPNPTTQSTTTNPNTKPSTSTKPTNNSSAASGARSAGGLAAGKVEPGSTDKSQPKPDSSDKNRRLNPIKLRQMKDRQRSIEDEITRLEVEILDFEQALSHFQSAEHSADIAGLLESRRTDMQNLLAEWEEVSQTIEANR
jgi:ATP-binding cassette subfamily F protein 3